MSAFDEALQPTFTDQPVVVTRTSAPSVSRSTSEEDPDKGSDSELYMSEFGQYLADRDLEDVSRDSDFDDSEGCGDSDPEEINESDIGYFSEETDLGWSFKNSESEEDFRLPCKNKQEGCSDRALEPDHQEHCDHEPGATCDQNPHSHHPRSHEESFHRVPAESGDRPDPAAVPMCLSCETATQELYKCNIFKALITRTSPEDWRTAELFDIENYRLDAQHLLAVVTEHGVARSAAYTEDTTQAEVNVIIALQTLYPAIRTLDIIYYNGGDFKHVTAGEDYDLPWLTAQ
jgi:hypothetical protein